ncbi:MAG: hypothetical protein ACE5IO_10780 [Thermoplasmata archaeon]
MGSEERKVVTIEVEVDPEVLHSGPKAGKFYEEQAVEFLNSIYVEELKEFDSVEVVHQPLDLLATKGDQECHIEVKGSLEGRPLQVTHRQPEKIKALLDEGTEVCVLEVNAEPKGRKAILTFDLRSVEETEIMNVFE